VALSEIDRHLLDRCLSQKPRSWQDFVDRYMGLVVHVVNHTAQCRSMRLTPEDREDLVAEVFLEIIRNDFAVLRRFRAQSSLATYLTVVARRVVVRELQRRRSTATLSTVAEAASTDESHETRISDREEVERLLGSLDGSEAAVVRMYHLEDKSYTEISRTVGIPENSVGPLLSRARSKMRERADQPAG
jgi:RNA polymerase sigma-70 factor (ECF subfamily)